MRKHLFFVAAASLAVAGMGFNAARADDMNNNNQPAPGAQNVAPASTQPSGSMVADADAKAVRDLLGQVTTTALSHDGFSTVATYLQRGGHEADAFGTPAVKGGTKGQAADDNSPNKEVGGKDVSQSAMVEQFKNYDDINAAVSQLQKDWKDKYNSDFAINGDNRSLVFNDSFRIMQGNIGEEARTAGQRIAPDDTNLPNNNNQPDDRAMHHASVVVSPAENIDAFTLRLTNVGQPANVWKIRIARDQNEQMIHDALLKQLNALHDNRNNWPSDQNEGYRVVSAHILSAFARPDQGAMQGGDMQGNQGQPLPK